MELISKLLLVTAILGCLKKDILGKSRSILYLPTERTVVTYLRRQQERGLVHKTRRLMDENSVFLQMYLILFSFITLGSESLISAFKQCQSNT